MGEDCKNIPVQRRSGRAFEVALNGQLQAGRLRIVERLSRLHIRDWNIHPLAIGTFFGGLKAHNRFGDIKSTNPHTALPAVNELRVLIQADRHQRLIYAPRTNKNTYFGITGTGPFEHG